MKEALAPVAEWLGGNWGWVLTVFLALFEISPIKLHPITAVLGWIGKKLTGDIRKAIAELREDVDAQQMDTIRTTVLNFSNSCLNGGLHTKEEFDHILEINAKYVALVEKYGIENEKYTEAYAYIKRIYRKRMDKRDFLSAPPPEPGEEV